MGLPKTENSDYDVTELSRKYEELQLRVTRFSVTEQELIHARDRLDRELMVYRRMQQFNSRALEEMKNEAFAKLVTESLIDIFEVELAFVLIESDNASITTVADVEGFTIPVGARAKLHKYICDQFSNRQEVEVICFVPDQQDAIREVFSFSSVIFTCVKEKEAGLTISLLGGVSSEKRFFYEPVSHDREAAFSVFSQQVLAQQTNRAKTQTIKEHFNALSVEQHRLSGIAETFLGFTADPDSNIQRIVDLASRLLNGATAVYEKRDAPFLVTAGFWGDATLANKAEGKDCCYTLFGSGSRETLHLPQLKPEMIKLRPSWLSGFEGSTFLGSRVAFDNEVIGTLAFFLPAREQMPDSLLQLIRILSAAIAVEERRKNAVLALRDSEEKYRMIFEGSPNGIIVADTETFQFRYVNIAIHNMFGYTEQEMLNMSVPQIHPADVHDLVMHAINDMIAGKAMYANEIPCLRKNGSVFYADVHSNVISLGGEKLIAGFFTDVTQRRNDRQALLEGNSELKKINAELDNFVYSVSHDLRSPLLAIQGLVRLIQTTQPFQPETLAYFNMVTTSVNRMDDTIKEILEYSRNARLDIKKLPIDFAGMIQQVFDDVKHIYPDPILMELEVNCMGPFYSDPNRVETLFKNIIGNSVKYQRRGAEPSYLKITVGCAGSFATIRFEDNGEGIGEEHLNRIFDMFYRASNTSVGTGLGLYICREIVNNLDGSIEVQSVPGKGSVFTVQLRNLK